ncbi:MAG TPA: thioredoxin [Clostridia bacterium]|nr:thioredoxin [Clostridia bacterium]
MSKNIVYLNQQNFKNEVLNNKNPVLIDFYADWCAPCRMITPILEQVAKEYEGKATIAKLDVDANNALASQFGVMSIPTLVFFRGGKEVQRVVGVRPKSELTRTLDKMIG